MAQLKNLLIDIGKRDLKHFKYCKCEKVKAAFHLFHR